MTEEALPLVHCYCFSAEDAAQDGWLRVGAALGVDMRGRATRAHKVRSVAPGKDMYCLEFRLPLDAALAPPTYAPTAASPLAKRARLSADDASAPPQAGAFQHGSVHTPTQQL